ncbi:hypothetical protein LCGC14_2409360 [marine sediment metagenome]|uniref:Uncharacterized protein n=1 Tax=marine sediment metagenome TaxID=412755 RepID=A0A0F9BSU0_9ZZZZ
MTTSKKKRKPPIPNPKPKAPVRQLPGKPKVPPISYTVTTVNVGELVGAINELITGKFTKKVFFDIINTTFIPNFAEPEKKNPKDKK